MLATSREPLRLRAEREREVTTLALPSMGSHDLITITDAAAVRLFIVCAQAASASFELTQANAPVVAAICRQLDGLPLAIELAAARSRHLTPEELLKRLHSQLHLLIGGARDLPERQQTMRTTIDWSYNLLSPAERLLFAHLAVFAGGCTLDAAEAICAEERDPQFLDRLASLIDKSLVRRRLASE